MASRVTSSNLPGKMRISETQRRFVEAYARKPNGKAAAIEAGYGVAGAKTRASEQLARPEIQELLQAEIKRRRHELAENSALAIDPYVKRRLVEHFDGDAARARRAVERAILSMVTETAAKTRAKAAKGLR